MDPYSRESLTEFEAAAATHLFDRIVGAERDRLTDEQIAKPREYLLGVWHIAAEAVMRPIQTRIQLEEELRQLRQDSGKSDLPF